MIKINALVDIIALFLGIYGIIKKDSNFLLYALFILKINEWNWGHK